MITYDNIDYNKALKYLGYPRNFDGQAIALSDPKTMELFHSCALQLFEVIRPNYIYKIFKKSQLEGQLELIVSNDITQHLQDCTKVAVIALTLGNEVDTLIRSLQIEDLSKAIVVDSLASVATEQICSEIITTYAQQNPTKFITWGFSAGYGDYPLQLQHKILSIVDAGRKIGLFANESFALSPTKSITTLVGISDDPIPRKRQSCECCKLFENCNFRKWDEHCDY